jgi:hypothetical protein
MLPRDFTNIFIDGILMQIHVSFWSGARILRPEDLGLKPEQVATAYKLGRKMLIPEEVIRNFRRIEGQARRLIEEKSYEFPFGNARFVPRRVFAKVTTKLEDLKAEYMALVDDLVAKYDQYRQEILPVYEEAADNAFLTSTPAIMEGSLDTYDREADRAAFKAQFLARLNSYYPPVESLKARFSLVWDVYEIAAPQLRDTSSEAVIESIEEREKSIVAARAQMQNKIEGFVGDVVKVLRTEATEVCSRIATAIKEGRVIRSTTVNSLKNFIEKFKDMNFVGDKTIEAQLDAIQRELLDAHPDTAFLDNVELKEELGRRLATVVEEAGKLSDQDLDTVTGGYKRKVNW